MLTRIQIKNFQAHADLDLQLDPGVNCIVGPSDVGKSAVLRAVGWVATNRPTGTAYVRHGSPGAAVCLTVDGHRVARSRGKTNLYRLDGTRYDNPSEGIPPPIADLLRLGPTNFQWQHAPAYWLSDTPGAVSKALNAVVDLGVIDDVLADLKRQHTTAKASHETAHAELGHAVARLEATDWVADAVEVAKYIDGVQTDHNALGERCMLLSTRLDLARDMQEEVRRTDEQLKTMRALVGLADAAAAAHQRYERLRVLVHTAKTTHTQPPPVTPARVQQELGVATRADRLAGLLAQASDMETKADDAAQAAAAAHAEMKELTRGKCPICGSRMPAQ